MKNKLLLLAVLALAMTGCKLMEPRPESQGSSTNFGGKAPKLPDEKAIPDTEDVPTLPASTHIIVGMCPATRTYAAMGVDTGARRFTFLISGSERTLQRAFQRFYETGAPVTVYTQPVKVRIDTALGISIYDPCRSLQSGQMRGLATEAVVGPQANVAEDPPPSPKPTGAQRSNLQAFGDLSWKTAFAVDAVTDPVASGTTVY